jgi:trk system potassium uptake protein TrkA
MNIVILGAGTIGSYLATKLAEEEHNVVVIDRDPKALERIARSADVATKLGSGTDWKVLEELSEEAIDFFIAMSSDDETNLVACAIAKNLGFKKTVARIRQNGFLDHSRLEFGRLFFVDHLLGTELLVAHDLFKQLMNPADVVAHSFANGSVQMRTVVIPSTFQYAGLPLSVINLNSSMLIGLIRRKIDGKGQEIIFPKPHDHLLPGDEATVIGKTEAMHQVSDLFGLSKKQIRSVAIVGGSGVVINLCQLLEKQKIEIKIIEQDEERCKLLSQLFPLATILNHDGTDLAFLKEEGIAYADYFIACTQSQETNILVGALARQAGCKQVIAVVSEEGFAPLLEQLGITHTLSQRASIARSMHSILQDAAFVSIDSLHENLATIMEVKVSSDSGIVGTPISDLTTTFPHDFLIAVIENRSGVMIPNENSVLTPGDTAIVLCSPKNVSDIEKIF